MTEPTARVPGPPEESIGDAKDAVSLGEREEEALSGGATVKDLEAQATGSGARDTSGSDIRIPPLSVNEQVAAASSDTGQAQAEEKSLSSYLTAEELALRARQMEDDRHQRFKDAFESIAIQGLYIGAIVLGVLSTVWALHLILPSRMRWLTAEDMTHIQTLLTAGVLVGAVGGHFKKRLREEETQQKS